MTTTEMTSDFVIEIGKRLIGEQLRQAKEQGFKQGFEQGREQGFKQGFKQGFEQGLEQGRSEILDFVKQGLTYEEISRKLENPDQI